MKAMLLSLVVVALAATCVSGQTWRKARMTHFTSYPECCDDPNADPDECDNYNGCKWKGQFAFVDGPRSLEWVRSNDIIAVHQKDGNQYRLKTLEVRKNGRTHRGIVYDICADSDCNGCCTRNAGPENFLIDLEHYTYQRFGQTDGVIEWRCVNC